MTVLLIMWEFDNGNNEIKVQRFQLMEHYHIWIGLMKCIL